MIKPEALRGAEDQHSGGREQVLHRDAGRNQDAEPKQQASFPSSSTLTQPRDPAEPALQRRVEDAHPAEPTVTVTAHRNRNQRALTVHRTQAGQVPEKGAQDQHSTG